MYAKQDCQKNTNQNTLRGTHFCAAAYQYYCKGKQTMEDIKFYTSKDDMITELLRYENEYLKQDHFIYEEAERVLVLIKERQRRYLLESGKAFAEEFGKRVKEIEITAVTETVEGYKQTIAEYEKKKEEYLDRLKGINENENPESRKRAEELKDLIKYTEEEIEICNVTLKIHEGKKKLMEQGGYPITEHLQEFSKRIDSNRRNVQRTFKYIRWGIKLLLIVAAYWLGKEITKTEPCDNSAPFIVLAFYFGLDLIVDYLQDYFLKIPMKRLLVAEVKYSIAEIEKKLSNFVWE